MIDHVRNHVARVSARFSAPVFGLAAFFSSFPALPDKISSIEGCDPILSCIILSSSGSMLSIIFGIPHAMSTVINTISTIGFLSMAIGDAAALGSKYSAVEKGLSRRGLVPGSSSGSSAYSAWTLPLVRTLSLMG